MLRPLFAATALLASLTACQAETDDVATPAPTVTGAANTQAPVTMPEQPGATESPALNEAEPKADECGADKLARWLNVLPTDTVKTEIRETVGHDRIRYIAPGDAVTMDLRADRLNVETGEDGRIKLFRCG